MEDVGHPAAENSAQTTGRLGTFSRSRCLTPYGAGAKSCTRQLFFNRFYKSLLVRVGGAFYNQGSPQWKPWYGLAVPFEINRGRGIGSDVRQRVLNLRFPF